MISAFNLGMENQQFLGDFEINILAPLSCLIVIWTDVIRNEISLKIVKSFKELLKNVWNSGESTKNFELWAQQKKLMDDKVVNSSTRSIQKTKFAVVVVARSKWRWEI